MNEIESTPRSRRQVLALLGGAGAALVIAGCGGSSGSDGKSGGSSSSTTTTGGATATDDAVASCTTIPEETAGPFPGDGSNGPDVLSQDGVVRRDIRSSFGSSSGVAEGLPLTLELTVTDSSNGCKPLEGAAVYVWHCNIDGEYSMYGQGVEDENYLRGVQVADADGVVQFTSIFPAAYSGRWPHVHFEVYANVDDATGGGATIATSQLAFPADVCKAVYATDGYSQSIRNLARTSLTSDMVFSDGVSQQTPTMSGDVTSGYTAKPLAV